MKLVQGGVSVEFEVVESLKLSGGKPNFTFFETIEGLPKPVKHGRSPREWSFTTEPLPPQKAKTLRSMFESGQVCQFVVDDDSYNVVIVDLSLTDYGDYVDASVRLREVDVDSVIEIG